MTKKTFLFVCLLGTLAPGTHAYNLTIPVECTISVEEGDKLPLQIKKDKEEEGNGEPDSKTIIPTPNVTLRENTLHFITSCNGCTFRLVQNNNICYEVDIIGNTLTIPSTFTGTYELQIVSGEYIFWCEIEL